VNIYHLDDIPGDLRRFFKSVPQLGLEKTPAEYVAKLVAGFRELKRVLRDDGTLWLNMGDSMASGKGTCFNPGGGGDSLGQYRKAAGVHPLDRGNKSTLAAIGLKPKDLLGIPWRVAFALQEDGWYLRSEIIWAKRNCMPESVTDRPTKSHEQIFLLSKKQNYYYDSEAVKVPASDSYANDGRWKTGGTEMNCKAGYAEAMAQNPKMPHRVFNGERRSMVNLRDVWRLANEPFKGAHFATFPKALVLPCILAGTSARGCCMKCRAPWVRVVEHRGETRRQMMNRLGQSPKNVGEQGLNHAGHHGGNTVETSTTGWAPACKCQEESSHEAGEQTEPVPCTVLDPFAGSGTTLEVALHNGRDAIGIELNPEYIPLIRGRCGLLGMDAKETVDTISPPL
jgi:DNA modification methylase